MNQTEHYDRPDQEQVRKANLRVMRKTILVVVAMFGFGYALVPLYSALCQALGINGQTEQISIAQLNRTEVDKTRTVTVEFDAVVNSKLPWEFKPLVRKVTVHPGEMKQVAYLAKNMSGSAIVGQAVHSVNPPQAAGHFKKTECFCYSQQKLKSGESKEMPVVFMLDPELPKGINTVTLSYTFWRADKYAAVE